jgi:hypothetical protein
MIDLEERLRDTGRELVLRTPLSEVTARGETLRQRRRTRRAGIAAAASVAVVGGMLVVTNAIGEPATPDPDPDRVAVGWSDSLNGLPGDVLADYTALCAAIGDGPPAATPPAMAETFGTTPVASTWVDAPGGELAVLVFQSAGSFATCVVDPDGPDGGFVTMSQFLPRLKETGAYITPTGTYGSTDVAIATGLTSPEVSAVQITIEGIPIKAAVEGGVFAAVVPADGTRKTLLDSTVEAYDANGTLLEQVPLLR